MKIAIMQPYFFPYIGYFQLVNAVDRFVFYDDVNFIKNGWINRNKIFLNKQSKHFTVNLKDASSNKRIYEVGITDNREKLIKTIMQAYRKAPFFLDAWPVIETVLNNKTEKISELAAFSVLKTCEYLNVKTSFEFSSEKYYHSVSLRKDKRLIEICRLNNSDEYINPIGGTGLYEKVVFAEKGINLHFLRTNAIRYQQFGEVFIPNLSVIDVMMFNSIEQIHEMLENFELI